MQRGIIAAGLLAGALVASPWARAEDVQKAKQDAQQDVSKAKAEAARHTDAVATENDRTATNHHGEQRSIFEGKSNFDVKGRIEKVAGHSVTVHRDELPSVTLSTAPSTRITVNGNDRATSSELRPGQDVSASFNLEGSKPIAVEIKANTHR